MLRTETFDRPRQESLLEPCFDGESDAGQDQSRERERGRLDQSQRERGREQASVNRVANDRIGALFHQPMVGFALDPGGPELAKRKPRPAGKQEARSHQDDQGPAQSVSHLP